MEGYLRTGSGSFLNANVVCIVMDSNGLLHWFWLENQISIKKLGLATESRSSVQGYDSPQNAFIVAEIGS